MEKKKLSIKGDEYDFFYDDRNNMWRVIENSSIIKGQVIDLEIDLTNFTGQLDWQEVERFIESMKNNNSLHSERIEDAKEVLQSFFKSINKGVYDNIFFEHIKFNLSGIYFKGSCKNVNLIDKFEYDYFFFPQYSKDPYQGRSLTARRTVLKRWRHRPSDCHAGVAPFNYQSGSSIRGRPGVSQHARKRLKSLFHLGAMAAIRVKGEIQEYYGAGRPAT